jgi:hypothetical protein
MGCHSSKLHSDYDYVPPMRQKRRYNRRQKGYYGGYDADGLAVVMAEAAVDVVEEMEEVAVEEEEVDVKYGSRD